MNIVTHNTCIRPIIHTLTWLQQNFISFTTKNQKIFNFCMLKLMVKPYSVCSMEFGIALLGNKSVFGSKYQHIPY